MFILCKSQLNESLFVFTEAPEEPFDSRSLYDKLQEQKLKRDAEYEEAHKLSKSNSKLIIYVR